MSECPEPGIYPDVAFEEYCSWTAINSSSLKQMSISPAHFWASWQGHLHHDSKPLRFGRLVHSGHLEPLLLPQRYAVMPDYHLHEQNVTKDGKPSKSKGTTFYREKRAAFEQANEDREIVEADDYNAMLRTVTAVSQNRKASNVLNEKGRTELSIVWDDDATGLRCKARIDKELAETGGIADLKTCAQPEWFNWDLWKFGYWKQAAFYRDGWAAVNNAKPAPFWLVVVGPNDSDLCTCLAAPLSDDLLHAGETENMMNLSRARMCIENDHWPNIEEPGEWTGPKHKVEAYLNPEVQLEWSE